MFRYALERWPVDPYRAVAVETKPFTKAEEKTLGELHRQARSEDLNLQLQTMTAAAFSKSTYGRHLAEPVTQNTLLLFYPVSAGLLQPVWRAGISVDTAEAPVFVTTRTLKKYLVPHSRPSTSVRAFAMFVIDSPTLRAGVIAKPGSVP